MKRHRFGDSSRFQPFLQRVLCHAALESLENCASAKFSTKFVGFHADGQGGFGLCLLSTDTDAIASFWCFLYVFPFQVKNVADTQSG